MTFTGCESKNKVFRRTQISKGPPIGKKYLAKQTPERFGYTTIFFYSVQYDVLRKISLVNSISNKMIRV